MVPGLIFKSLMHSKLIFVYGVRQWSIISFFSFLSFLCVWLSAFPDTVC